MATTATTIDLEEQMLGEVGMIGQDGGRAFNAGGLGCGREAQSEHLRRQRHHAVPRLRNRDGA